MENKQRWKRASIIRRLSNDSLQPKRTVRQERFEFEVLRERVHKTDTDYRAIADEPFLNIGVPENKIDVKVVLMALREEILELGIRVSNREFPKGTNVVIPSLKAPFDIWYENNAVYFKRYYFKKVYRIPCDLDGSKIPEEIIDVLCAIVEHHKINDFNI